MGARATAAAILEMSGVGEQETYEYGRGGKITLKLRGIVN
jgi:hypothetical protein